LKIFGKRLLRRIFETKKEEVAERWEQLHDEELHKFYSTHIIRLIKSQRKR
jgi:hypothetical protein